MKKKMCDGVKKRVWKLSKWCRQKFKVHLKFRRRKKEWKSLKTIQADISKTNSHFHSG